MDIDFFVLTLASLFNLILSGFIFLRNPRARLNQFFGVFGLIIIVWTVFNFAADHSLTLGLPFTQLTLFFGAGVVVALFVLCTIFPEPKPFRRRWWIFYGLSAATLALCFTPYFVESVKHTSHGAELTVGPLYTWFSVFILIAIVWSLVVVLRGARHRSPTERSQIRLFATGIIIYTTFAFLSNVLLPILINNWSSSRFGPIFTIPFVGVMAYAIIKHHLFDMRLAITRAVGFIVTIVVVSVAYSLLVVGLSIVFVPAGEVTLFKNPHELILFLPPLILIALTASFVQRSVARITKGIFFQDSYDTREVLDRFSDALISDNDLDAIMTRGLTVLSEALKPARALFVVLDDIGNEYRVQLYHRTRPSNIAALVEAAKVHSQPIALRDEDVSGRWHKALVDDDVALVLRLGAAKKLVGVLLFGPKQDGRVYTKQDLQLLGVGAKNLGIAIENAKKYEQIATFADTLRVEVEKATTNLRRANTKLKTLDAMKDDFLSMASHQLRSPATSVRDAIQMLEKTYLTEAERKRTLELADASSERLVNVVTDMLSVARIQAGHFTVEKTSVEMIELVSRTIDQADALAQSKGITISAEYPKQPVRIKADRAKIIEILSNYLENAIRYSNEHGVVTVTLKQEGRKVIFEVRDHGIGVPLSERKHLFDKFFRASNARKNQPNGNGIGLFVVKTVAKAHGGDAYYEPQKDGSLFGFWLKS